MTPRHVFQRVKAHLLEQNAKAITPEGDCQYKTAEGLQCALGCLIKPEAYTKAAEGWNMAELHVAAGDWAIRATCDTSRDVRGPIALAMMLASSDIPATQEMHDILTMLQDIHDNMEVKDWPAELAELEAKLP